MGKAPSARLVGVAHDAAPVEDEAGIGQGFGETLDAGLRPDRLGGLAPARQPLGGVRPRRERHRAGKDERKARPRRLAVISSTAKRTTSTTATMPRSQRASRRRPPTDGNRGPAPSSRLLAAIAVCSGAACRAATAPSIRPNHSNSNRTGRRDISSVRQRTRQEKPERCTCGGKARNGAGGAAAAADARSPAVTPPCGTDRQASQAFRSRRAASADGDVRPSLPARPLCRRMASAARRLPNSNGLPGSASFATSCRRSNMLARTSRWFAGPTRRSSGGLEPIGSR